MNFFRQNKKWLNQSIRYTCRVFSSKYYFFGGKFTFFACLDATLNQVNTNKFLLRKKAGVLEKYLQSIMNGQSRTILIGVESLDQKKYRKLPNNQGSTSFVQFQLFFPLSHFKASDLDLEQFLNCNFSNPIIRKKMLFGNLATKWTLKTVLCCKEANLVASNQYFMMTLCMLDTQVVVGKNPTTPKIFATIRLA